ncbi:MAG: alpha-mannosidase, partial [Calditrichaeota bacterium]
SGYHSYLFGRPRSWEMELPDSEFIWVGFDGSEIMANRFRGWYHTPLGKARSVTEERIPELAAKAFGVLLWGVGNHGGGVSRQDLDDMNALIAERDDVKLMHSTPEAYFDQLAQYKRNLPRWRQDFNPWATGCYTSQIRVKQKHRLLENELFSAEKMATIAAANGLIDYPRQELNDALIDLLTGEFHDILPGSSIMEVEEDALRLFDHGLEICSRIKAHAFFALAGGQAPAATDTIPIFVFNPHPYTVKTVIECEFNLADFDNNRIYSLVHVQRGGKWTPAQIEQESSNMPMDWRKKVVFYSELAAQQMNRFDCRIENVPAKPITTQIESGENIHFKTQELDIVINGQTGLMDRWQIHGVDFINERAFQAIVCDDIVDSWARFEKRFDLVLAAFELMLPEDAGEFAGLPGPLSALRMIEDGDVRMVVEGLYSFHHSHLIMHFKLPKIGTEIEVELRVYWHEKTKMLKLLLPMPPAHHRYIGQTAFGVNELPNNGDEAVSQKWCAVLDLDRDVALSCINDGIYGSDFSDEGLRLTLLRSPIYSGEEIDKIPQDRFRARLDQGERVYKFWFNGGTIADRTARIDREALAKNETPYALSYFPHGKSRQAQPLILLHDDVIQLSTAKYSEEGDQIIFRLFNPTDSPQSSLIEFAKWNRHEEISFQPFEIKSFRVNPHDFTLREIDLMENIINGNV